jgi:hypothetical protein
LLELQEHGDALEAWQTQKKGYELEYCQASSLNFYILTPMTSR